MSVWRSVRQAVMGRPVLDAAVVTRWAHTEELSLDLMCTASFEGYLTHVNPAATRILGWDAEELLARPFLDFVHPEDREATEAEAAKIASFSGDAVHFRNRYRTESGEYRWLEWNARASKADQMVYAIARDVTSEVEAQIATESQRVLLERLLTQRERDLDEARLETLRRLALAAEYRDDDTQRHTDRVGHTARLIACQLGIDADEARVIRRAAPLHDVGKLAITDTILLKPGKLTDVEIVVMQTHAEAGHRILAGSHSPILQRAAEIALTHHERWDGSGYPHHLSGDRTPLSGRIVAVADVFDALTHKRPYKPAWTVPEAVAEITRQRRRAFDPDIVRAFLSLNHHQLLHPDHADDEPELEQPRRLIA